jgi:predicted DNA-binding transcriptional regulator AlpA
MQSAQTDNVLLRPREVAALLSVSLRSIYHQISRDPRFPASVRIGRARRWLRDEIVDYLKTRCERDVPPSRRS